MKPSYRILTCCLTIMALPLFLFSQPMAQKQKKGGSIIHNANIEPIKIAQLNRAPKPLESDLHTSRSYRSLQGKSLVTDKIFASKTLYKSENGSLWSEGTWNNPSSARGLNIRQQHQAFLNDVIQFHRDSDESSFQLLTHVSGSDNVSHSKYQQEYLGFPIWDNQLSVHQKGDEFTLTGIVRPLSKPIDVKYEISGEAAMEIVSNDLIVKSIHLSQSEHADLMEDDVRELVIYRHEGDFRLVWHISIHPNPSARIEYFVDALDGRILREYESICKLHHLDGSLFFNETSEGTGLDLSGASRNISTWFYQGAHYLVDATKSMFSAGQSRMPGNPVGAIITLDAQNTFPGNDNFEVKDLVSFATTWDNPTAVSAHINVAQAYDFFEDKFNRVSINGQGGNVISLVNVIDEDGEDMDNAFWNGKAMFFGNGNQAFDSPLPKSLDVTVHELSHGVVQTTANLNYQGESGALNESFADVFAVLVDDEDWLIGEDVVNQNVFRSGALRNVSDPENGGSKLSDPGYQPATYVDRYKGSEDNGGVHINSGIANRAFYLFATDVGRDVAGQVYYNVLSNYLTRSSQFVDMRIAVVDASRMMYGESVANAARSAFDAVGILGDEGGDYVVDEEENPGVDLIFVSDENQSRISLVDGTGNIVQDPLTDDGLRNPPSITDNGDLMVYVAGDKTIHFVQFDWSASPPTFSTGVLEANPIWDNVAVSRDGLKIAAVPSEASDSIFVFSLEQGNVKVYELSNPTTSSDEVSTGDVLFADAIEWDHSGEFLIYDAFNRISNAGSIEAIVYWDIGFIRVWDNNSNSYGNGRITKLFSGLPENVSVGNPTFAENSPYIIAFDLLDESGANDVYNVMGANIETGDIGTLYENTTIGYPSYSRSDDKIIFDAEGDDGISTVPVIGQVSTSDDKINGIGSPSILRESASWGVWFSNGVRDLATPVIEDEQPIDATLVYPNPVKDVLYIKSDWEQPIGKVRFDLRTIDGKTVLSKEVASFGPSLTTLEVADIPGGIYLLTIRTDKGHRVYQINKP